MLFFALLLLIAWGLSHSLPHRLVPSESLLALVLVGITVMALFQMGELG